jgi:hypothetical protein
MLAVASLAFAAAQPSSDDVRERRLIRVERPFWRQLLGAPTVLLEALHWPLKQFLDWGESVRLDRRIRDTLLFWKDNDDQPIPEPAKDDAGNHVWWDFYSNCALRPLERVVDPTESVPAIARFAGLVRPEEAVNVNALDEAPDSTWFTNRHARSRLTPEVVERGPDQGPPPSADGPLVVFSGKELGTQPGFWIRDQDGRSYLLKFDPRGYPDLATGAELVSSKILYALGWNVAEYHLFSLDPRRLVIDDKAWMLDSYNRKEAVTTERLARILATAERGADGNIRAIASRELPGKPKGGFRMTGMRGDDPNDTIPHQDRRDLRGLAVVAAWLEHIDFRSGNTLDTFVRGVDDPEGRGHLVHYLLDLNGTLGSWGVGWKSDWMGHEYVCQTLPAMARTLHLWHPGWADTPLVHRSIGYFGSEHFDPDHWKPLYPVPPFERATFRDRFWGARLVSSLRDADLRAVVGAAAWSDPRAGEILVGILRARQRRIAEAYFDLRHVNPIDEFAVEGDELRFRDLGVESGVAERESARYRFRTVGSESASQRPRVPIGKTVPDGSVEIETSHDEGRTWSPPLAVSIQSDGSRSSVVAVERSLR